MAKKIKRRLVFFVFSFVFGAVLFGGGLGIALAETVNIINTENFIELTTALPTKLLDINGELITELAGEEKREIINFKQLPKHLVDALIIREDRIFYSHRGFSFKAIVRAVVGQLTGRQLGGGSTLTQQIAGTIYADRTDVSYMRKLRELWWAIQMERRYSKDEILEIYLNRIYFGAGTYGVSAATKYYFGHDVDSLTPAESAILVVQLANPASYNPFDYPNRAMDRQKNVLDTMTEFGYLTAAEATATFEDFWANFDYTRINSSSFFSQSDRAPWFSEFVRRELGTMVYGAQDIYTGGFTVNTTLNLKHQQTAQEVMTEYSELANRRYRNSSRASLGSAAERYIPITELLTLVFDLPGIKVSDQRSRLQANSAYLQQINPIVDVLSMMFNLEGLKVDMVGKANEQINENVASDIVEGTLISLENDTGAITALIGGNEFTEGNQFIRAVQARLQPGSAFKPLYYSAAIDSRKFTQVTQLDDAPYVFYNEYNIPYIPINYGEAWHGSVPLYRALAMSYNIPALHILDGIGFDAAINRSVALLGISKEELPSRGFDRVYPLGLGSCSVRPVEMARAYAIFANGGREITPYAIRTVEDRNGRVFLNPEQENWRAIQAKGEKAQVISPQNAFIMNELLKYSSLYGILNYGSQSGRIFTYRNSNGASYVMPSSGKTGTTQNWGDAWTVGSTPYLTTAVWFGFDKKGKSLGEDQTGSMIAAPAWGKFMKVANEDYAYKEFPRPQTGVAYAEVCSVSGLLLTPECGNARVGRYFLAGTQPITECTYHKNVQGTVPFLVDRLKDELFLSGMGVQLPDTVNNSLLVPDLSFLDSSPILPEETKEIEDEDTLPPDESETTDFNFLLD
jgi:penicillin-binding protein 1A